LRTRDRRRPGLLLGLARVAVETEGELCVGEPKLAIVDFSDLLARLEVLDRDAELLRELAKRLDRGRARAGLDARDIGVGDAGGREVALRETSLDAQALEACADAFSTSSLGHHQDH
jgi:hypothetical protein